MKTSEPPTRISSDLNCTIIALPFAEFPPRENMVMSAGKLPAADLDASAKGQIKIRMAHASGIRREASMLLNERYIQRGYGPQEIVQSANRLTIVAYDGATPIGTLSVGFDSADGLLCDDLYQQEVDRLRGEGRKVCEFIKLAVSSSSASVMTLAALFHVAFIHAYKIHGFDDVVMEVNPRHMKFYKRALGFEEIGGPMINQRVSAPAVLLHCGLAYIDTQLRHFGGNMDARKYERSIYPYGFSTSEERGITQRLLALYAAGQA